jgi:hypothetical protein
MQLLRIHHEKLVFALAVLALGLGLLWVQREQVVVQQVRAEPMEPGLVGSAHVRDAASAPAAPKVVWTKPVPSPADDGWASDLFTPPDVILDAVTGSFVAARSAGPAGPVAGTSLSLQLLAVKQEAYRLQLAGYFGHADDYLGAFVSSQTAETLLAKAGHRFAALGLTLKNFDVRTVLLDENEAGPVYEAAALAVLHDEQTGADVVLDSRRPLFTGKLLAVFGLSGEGNASRELREGDSFSLTDAVYRVERILLEPAEVVLSRSAPALPAPELQVLRPEGQASAKSRPAAPSGPPPSHLAAWRD